MLRYWAEWARSRPSSALIASPSDASSKFVPRATRFTHSGPFSARSHCDVRKTVNIHTRSRWEGSPASRGGAACGPGPWPLIGGLRAVWLAPCAAVVLAIGRVAPRRFVSSHDCAFGEACEVDCECCHRGRHLCRPCPLRPIRLARRGPALVTLAQRSSHWHMSARGMVRHSVAGDCRAWPSCVAIARARARWPGVDVAH